MTKVSVVIPIWNHWELTHSLLFSLYNHCRNSIEEILLLDSSTEPDGFDWWEESNLLPVQKFDVENSGFLLKSNYGLKMAKGEIKILISNDVKVYGDFVESVLIGAIAETNWLCGGKLYTQSTGWNDFDGKIFPYLEGWLLASNNWEELGYFDERYAPNDFEDVDLSTTAISKNYRLFSLEMENVVQHIGGQTLGYNPERQKITEANREKFRKKWMR